MSRLLLVRHGRTKLHEHDRFWGSTDVPLSDAGIRQAERLRDRLSQEKIKSVYASKLGRARVTAEIIVAGRSVDIAIREELSECNFGYAEGLTFSEISTQYPQLARELSSLDTVACFPGGESFDELNTRVKIFTDKLGRHKPKDTVLVVAHGGPLQLLICHLLGIDVRHWRQWRLDMASLSIVETYPRGAILNLLNDVSHLRM